MPSGLKRLHSSGQTHFITFGCWHRRQNLADAATKQAFLEGLERIRRSFLLRIYGYVVMPDHVHLLLSEPDVKSLAVAIQSLKQGVSRKYVGNAPHFWQHRYFDLNVRDHFQFYEKLNYIHRNPVRKHLCNSPEDWTWSSFRHYATGCEGTVEIESEWTARKRERRTTLSGDLQSHSSKRATVAHSSRFCLGGEQGCRNLTEVFAFLTFGSTVTPCLPGSRLVTPIFLSIDRWPTQADFAWVGNRDANLTEK
jgi:putative transposase